MKFLYAKFPDFNATDLSYFSQELFRDEIKKDREKMFEFGKIDIKPYLEEVKKETESGTNARESTSTNNSVSSEKAREREQILDFGFDEEKSKGKQTQTVKKSNTASKDKNLAGNDMTASRIIEDVSKATKPGQTKSTLGKKIDSTKTRMLKNELKKSSPTKKSSSGTIAALLAVVVGSGAYLYISLQEPAQSPVVVDAPVVKTKNVKSDGAREPANDAHNSFDKGNIVLSHFDKQKMQVFVDGQKREVDLLSNIKVPMSKEFSLRVQIEGKKHFIKEMRVDNASAVEVEVPDMPAIAYGYLNTSSACAQGEIRFELYGEKRVSPIPMAETFGIAFPLALDDKGQLTPQSYEIFFKKKGEDIEHKLEITLNREDQTIDLCDQL